MLVLIIFLFVFLNSSPVSAKDAGLNVGTINSNKILQSYSKAQQMLRDLAKAEADLNRKISAKRQEIEKAKKANKTDTELQMLLEQMRLEIEPEARKIEEDSNKKSAQIEENIKNAIDATAKSGKYDLILIEEAVLYGGSDITDTVLKKLGK